MVTASKRLWIIVVGLRRPGCMVRYGCEMRRSRPGVPLRATESGYIASLTDIEADNATGDIFIITDNRSFHNSAGTCVWLAENPVFTTSSFPKEQAWLNLQKGWWRLLRRDALAGQSFANPNEIEQATRVATAQLTRRAKPMALGTSSQGSSSLSPPLFVSPFFKERISKGDLDSKEIAFCKKRCITRELLQPGGDFKNTLSCSRSLGSSSIA
jgi:hypothetical protein